MAGRAKVIREGEGRTLFSGPLGAVLLAGRDATGGAATFVVHPLAPRALGSPLHTHRREDEWSIVLEGEIGVQLGDDVQTAHRGDLVVKPRGIPHAFWNPTDEPARLLDVIAPGGFEDYFERLGEILRPGGPPTWAHWSPLPPSTSWTSIRHRSRASRRRTGCGSSSEGEACTW